MVDDDAVFRALADPIRRLLLDALFERDGRSLGELEDVVNTRVSMTRFGVAKHLRLLEEAGLVVVRRAGRSKLHHLNPVPVQRIHERWIGKYTDRALLASVLLGIQRAVEDDATRRATTDVDTDSDTHSKEENS
jgi:DNA-binding transcriptional ArsR family regulator